VLASALLLCSRAASAQPALRVLRTLGDATEATCVEVDGNDAYIGTLGGGVFRVRFGQARQEQERFDSARGLAGNRVRDCAFSGDALYVATDAGLSRLERNAARALSLERGRFLRVAAAREHVIAARADGTLLRFERGVAQPPLATGTVASALAIASDGRFALGGIDGAIYVGRGAHLQRVARDGGDRSPIEWLSFERHGLRATTATAELKISMALGVTTSPPQDARGENGSSREKDEAQLAGLLVHDRARFGDGELIATDSGVWMRARKGAPLTRLALEGLACGDRISALAVWNGSMWIGSFDHGLCRLDASGAVTHFAGPSQLPSDMIDALASDADALYVATAAGLVVIDRSGTLTPFTETQCLGKLLGRCPWHAAVNGVAVDPKSGATWVADIGALHRIDPQSHDWRHLGGDALGSHAVTRVAARGGEVAVGTSDRGLLLLRDKGPVRALGDSERLADDWITDLAYDARGRLWIGTCTHGLSVRDEHGRFRSVSARDGLIDDYVLSVQELDGRIWVGTLSGVSVLDGDKVISLSTADGLAGNEVHDAVLYQGAVWLATDGGLSVISVAPASDGAPVSARATR
jgi:ligand-binding sensor domain-containing protein